MKAVYSNKWKDLKNSKYWGGQTRLGNTADTCLIYIRRIRDSKKSVRSSADDLKHVE